MEAPGLVWGSRRRSPCWWAIGSIFPCRKSFFLRYLRYLLLKPTLLPRDRTGFVTTAALLRLPRRTRKVWQLLVRSVFDHAENDDTNSKTKTSSTVRAAHDAAGRDEDQNVCLWGREVERV